MGKLDQAFKDVQRCATLEPWNHSFQEMLRRLNTSIQEKVKQTTIQTLAVLTVSLVGDQLGKWDIRTELVKRHGQQETWAGTE